MPMMGLWRMLSSLASVNDNAKFNDIVTWWKFGLLFVKRFAVGLVDPVGALKHVVAEPWVGVEQLEWCSVDFGWHFDDL